MWSFFEQYYGFFVYPVLSLVLSLALTRLGIYLLPRLGYLDRPGGRHIHREPVPRGGGVAVILAFFGAFALAALAMPDTVPPVPNAIGKLPLLRHLLWPALILAVLGLADDRWELKFWQKLLVQLAVVLVIWYPGAQEYFLFGWKISGAVSLLFQIVWFIVIINAFNLIDGLDGLASGLAVISSVCMAVWFVGSGKYPSEALCMLVLAGACLGFLRYNFYPARIFLGDTGSTFLGLIFALVGLLSIGKTVTLASLLLPLLAIGVPLFDVFLAVWRRGARKLLDRSAGGIMQADQDHLHHRLLRQSKKQSTAAVLMYLLAAVFAGISLLLLLLRDSVPTVAYITLVLAVLVMIRRFAGVEIHDSALLIRRGLAKPRRGILVNMIHPVIDCSLLSVSFLVSAVLVPGGFRHFPLFLFAVVPVVLALCFSGVYRVYWLRTALNNYRHLALTLLAGSLISCVLVWYFRAVALPMLHPVPKRYFAAGCLLFILLNLTLIGSERFLVHYAEGFLFRKLCLLSLDSGALRKTVVYGGGLNCRVYISYLFSATRGDRAETVIGIIDDDPGLAGLKVYGFPVFGASDRVESIYAKHPFRKLVVAADSAPPEKIDFLRRFCADKQIEFRKLIIEEKAI